MRIETIKSSQPTTYTLMRPSIIAHAFTHTHSGCKSNGGGHCVRQTSCVLVAAAVVPALYWLSFFCPFSSSTVKQHPSLLLLPR